MDLLRNPSGIPSSHAVVCTAGSKNEQQYPNATRALLQCNMPPNLFQLLRYVSQVLITYSSLEPYTRNPKPEEVLNPEYPNRALVNHEAPTQ